MKWIQMRYLLKTLSGFSDDLFRIKGDLTAPNTPRSPFLSFFYIRCVMQSRFNLIIFAC
jgi:hypothetical protein